VNLFHLVILAALMATAAPDSPAPILFAVDGLAGWTLLTESETVPYKAEGLGSELVYAARSPQGSYVFITRIDNSLKRAAPSVEEIEAFASAAGYARLRPEAFHNEIQDLVGPEERRYPILVNSFRTSRLAYDLGGPGVALAKTVFLPVVLFDTTRGEYRNLIYVANFRGRAGDRPDIEAFDRAWRRIELPREVSLIDAERFDALRAELAKAGSSQALAPKHGEREVVPAERAVDDLARELVSLLMRRDAAAGDRLSAAVEPLLPGTVLAGAVASLRRDRSLELQRLVGGRVFATTDATGRARLVALFLTEGIALGDRAAAEWVVGEARKAGISWANLVDNDQEALLDSVLAHPRAAPRRSDSVRSFLALESPAMHKWLRARLQARGFRVPDLRDVAELRRSGAVHLRAAPTDLRLPAVVWQDDRLKVLRSSSAVKPVLAVEELPDLWRLADTVE